MTVEAYEKSGCAVVERTLLQTLDKFSISEPQILINVRDTHQLKRAEEYFNIYNNLVSDVRGKGFRDGETLFEFGVGPGFLAQRFQEGGLRVYGADIKDNRENLFINLSISKDNLPFPDGYFDYVSITSVMHHIPSSLHRKYFGEFQRVLKQDGILLVQEDERGRNYVEHSLIRAVDRLVSGPEANAHRFKEEWLEFFGENGFYLRSQELRTHKKGFWQLNKLFYALTK